MMTRLLLLCYLVLLSLLASESDAIVNTTPDASESDAVFSADSKPSAVQTRQIGHAFPIPKIQTFGNCSLTIPLCECLPKQEVIIIIIY